MPTLIVAHDYICPWCWVAWEQQKRLKAEFPTLHLVWKGFDLLPEGMAYNPPPPDPSQPKKPRIPSRLELLLAADDLALPKRDKPFSRSRLALEGAEFAMENGRADEYHDAVYHLYWEESQDIADREVLREAARRAGLDVREFDRALDERRYRDRIIEFDEPAHAAGIWNVPTWEFPEEWIAEQPCSEVRQFAERFVRSGGGADV